MILFNGDLIFGFDNHTARECLLAWGKENNFFQLGDSDVTMDSDSASTFIVMDPDERIVNQIYDCVNKQAVLQNKTFSAQWAVSKDLYTEILSDKENSKDWFSIDPAGFASQSSTLNRYKTINWKYVKLEEFNNLVVQYSLSNFTINDVTRTERDKIVYFVASNLDILSELYYNDYTLYNTVNS